MEESSPRPGGRNQDQFDYIVVGSGAGGGTVAARLAEAGFTVALLEAGGDPVTAHGTDPLSDKPRLPEDYEVPCFHPFASENDGLSWDFFVRHYTNEARQETDPNYRRVWQGQPVDGVLYPRAGTLGGCTAHNAMIFIYPNDEDWNAIAELTQDASWHASRMRKYFQLLENCHHRPVLRWLDRLGINPSRHGFRGWLSTERATPMISLKNRDLIFAFLLSTWAAIRDIGHVRERLCWLWQAMLDPNDWRTVKEDSFGIRYLPLTTHKHARTGTRERLLEVQERNREKLHIKLHALATGVIFEGNNRAVGVRYLEGEKLYRPHAGMESAPGEAREVYATREVILAGGAFNTPQLLMLSGIGPRAELEHHGIAVRVDLAGVGKNLQDRYEVGVANRMAFSEWRIFKGARFDRGDPQYQQWRRGKGPYITNGAILSMYRRSVSRRPLPDLFWVAFLGRFQGYFPTYSKLFAENLNYLTWTILKAHTNNRGGEVRLRSRDPRDAPEINFHYFDEGTPGGEEDLDSVVDGILFARELTKPLRDRGMIAEETTPGENCDTREKLREFVRSHAWGHHASCTCAIGPKEKQGVLDSNFRVHGTEGLRVVDASVFPRIPGFFIASAVYMIGEKAAEVIIDAAKAKGAGSRGDG